MLPLMFSACNFRNGSTLTDANFINLLYDTSKLVKFARFTNASFVILTKRFRDKSVIGNNLRMIVVRMCVVLRGSAGFIYIYFFFVYIFCSV